jgi:hypothetical protein
VSVVRRPALSVLAGVLTAAALTLGPQPPATAAGPRVDLRVLVVTDGGASVSAVADQLRAEGVPHTTVDLRDSGRPVTTRRSCPTPSTGRRAPGTRRSCCPTRRRSPTPPR